MTGLISDHPGLDGARSLCFRRRSLQPALRQPLAEAVPEPPSTRLDPVAGVERDGGMGGRSEAEISVSRDLLVGRSRCSLPHPFVALAPSPPAQPQSFAYAMLVRELTATLSAVGFDPYRGFYHQPRYGRPALALDMMEPFRPILAELGGDYRDQQRRGQARRFRPSRPGLRPLAIRAQEDDCRRSNGASPRRSLIPSLAIGSAIVGCWRCRRDCSAAT